MTVAAVAAAVVAVTLSWGRTSGPQLPPLPPVEEPPVAPALWSPPEWDRLLGGDSAVVDESTWAALDSFSTLDDPDDAEADAAAVLTAKLTGDGTGAYPQIFDDDPFAAEDPDAALVGVCTQVDVVAVSSVVMPIEDEAGPRWAKFAVAWTGTCAGPAAPEPGEVRVAYTYAQRTGSGWRPVRETAVPGSGWRWLAAADGAELATMACANPAGQRAAVEVAAAFDVMCEDAAADGVTLEVRSGWRDATAQQRLWDTAVDQVGVDAARRWVVAPGAGGCTSRHCDGAAIDVVDDLEVLAWLEAPAACRGSSGALTDPAGGTCPRGSTPVPRHLHYGFVRPYAHIGTHLEWGLPLESRRPGGCGAAPDHGVPATIAAAWRCQLARAGVDAETIRAAAAGAVTQARCASGWNPGAVAAGGRYVDAPDPRTGKVDTRAGVHMLTREQADAHVDGGYRHVADTAASAAGAARMWLAGRAGDPWAGFECAAEAAAPPEWAFDY